MNQSPRHIGDFNTARQNWVGGVVAALLSPPTQMKAVCVDSAAAAAARARAVLPLVGCAQGCHLSESELLIGLRVRAEPTSWGSAKP